MALAAQFLDVNKLIQNYIIQDLPYYVIMDSSFNILSKNETDDNIETAQETLRQYFNNIDSSNRQIFIVRHYAEVPDKGFKKTTEFDVQSTFKNPQLPDHSYSSRNGIDSNYMLLEEMRAMRQELTELKMQSVFDDSDDDEETAKAAEPTGIIGAILGNPALTNVLVNILTNIGASLAMQPSQKQPLAMAGIDTLECDERAALDLLYQKGMKKTDLVKLSLLPSEKVKLYLSML